MFCCASPLLEKVCLHVGRRHSVMSLSGVLNRPSRGGEWIAMIDFDRFSHFYKSRENCTMGQRITINTVFVRWRAPNTIESGFDHSLQLSQFLISCALFFASVAGVCLQLHVDTVFRDIKGLSGEL